MPGAQVHRDRDWYPHKVTPTFTDMLGACRLQMWQYEVLAPLERKHRAEVIETLLNKMAAVASGPKSLVRGCEFFVICTVYADRLMDVSPGHSALSDAPYKKSAHK